MRPVLAGRSLNYQNYEYILHCRSCYDFLVYRGCCYGL